MLGVMKKALEYKGQIRIGILESYPKSYFLSQKLFTAWHMV